MRRAAVREAAEEVAVGVALDDLTFGHVMHQRRPDEERVDFFLVAMRLTGEPRIAEPHKCLGLTSTVEPG